MSPRISRERKREIRRSLSTSTAMKAERETVTPSTKALRLELVHKHCRVCGKKIKVMCMKGTGVCSEICRKKREGEALGNLESRTVG